MGEQVGVVWSVCLWLPGIRKLPKITKAEWMSLAPIGTCCERFGTRGPRLLAPPRMVLFFRRSPISRATRPRQASSRPPLTAAPCWPWVPARCRLPRSSRPASPSTSLSSASSCPPSRLRPPRCLSLSAHARAAPVRGSSPGVWEDGKERWTSAQFCGRPAQEVALKGARSSTQMRLLLVRTAETNAL